MLTELPVEALLEAMRPGHVQAPRRASDGAASESSDTGEKEGSDEEATLEDLQRQQGLDDDDDDFEEPLSRQLASTRNQQQPRLQSHSAASAAPHQNVPMGSDSCSTSGETGVQIDRAMTFSSVVRTQPAGANTSQHQHTTSRLSHLRGPFTHSLPALPSPTPTTSADTCHSLSSSRSLPDLSVNTSTSTGRTVNNLPPLLSLATHPTSSPAAVHAHAHDATTSVGQKRVHVHEESEETAEERKRRKRAEANSSRRRYKDYNMNAELKRVFKLAGDMIKVEWMCRNAYPSEEEEGAVIKEKFAQALRERGHAEDWYELSDQDIKLLEQEDSAMRSRIRTAAAQLVPQVYRFHAAPESDAERAANMSLAREALTDSRFTYAEPDKMEGRFQSALITNVIHKAFFAVPSSIGCIYQDALDPMPSRLIALAATAIHHILSSYQDGECRITPFTNEKWTEYDAFVNTVEQFEQGAMARLWRAHRHRVLSRCLSLAGVVREKLPEPPIKPIPADVLEREKRRLEALYGHSESELEDDMPPSCPNQHDHTHTVTMTAADEHQGVADFSGDGGHGTPILGVEQPGSSRSGEDDLQGPRLAREVDSGAGDQHPHTGTAEHGPDEDRL
ncbi:hypothetical protein BN946_scf184977.g105 [Trametes cinnabarina]|uniref:DUF6532 domain-containing protein n=1 Tax=Pycnoporus cinnabarinus TaxID=5643 RepID=A0A060SDY1_PYCCI|nr:hypothetical protein BN946_scf184977.g105 [Trametes cinnabarina]